MVCHNNTFAISNAILVLSTLKCRCMSYSTLGQINRHTMKYLQYHQRSYQIVERELKLKIRFLSFWIFNNVNIFISTNRNWPINAFLFPSLPEFVSLFYVSSLTRTRWKGTENKSLSQHTSVFYLLVNII